MTTLVPQPGQVPANPQQDTHRQQVQQMRERLNQIDQALNKRQQFILICIGAIVIALFLNVCRDTQHSDIKQMQDSLSNFYRDFDADTIKDLKPAVMEIIEKVLPLTKVNDHFKAPDPKHNESW